MGNNQLMSCKKQRAILLRRILDHSIKLLSLFGGKPDRGAYVAITVANAYKRLNKIPVNDQNLDDVRAFMTVGI